MRGRQILYILLRKTKKSRRKKSVLCKFQFGSLRLTSLRSYETGTVPQCRGSAVSLISLASGRHHSAMALCLPPREAFPHFVSSIIALLKESVPRSLDRLAIVCYCVRRPHHTSHTMLRPPEYRYCHCLRGCVSLLVLV